MLLLKLWLLQAERIGPAAVLIGPQEGPAFGLRRTGGGSCREVVHLSAFVHEGILQQDRPACLIFETLALHGLRDPIGIGELLQCIEMRILHHWHRIELAAA